MAIGTTTAILIAAGAAAGGQVASSTIASGASKDATAAQTDAADKALAQEKELFDLQRADLAPYRNVGQFSMGQLGHLVGMPPTFGTEAVDQATQPRTAVPRAPTASQSIWDRAQAARAKAEAQNTPEQSSGIGMSLRDLGAARQSASSFVRMRAPDGEEADVDPSEAAMFERMGARRV